MRERKLVELEFLKCFRSCEINFFYSIRKTISVVVAMVNRIREDYDFSNRQKKTNGNEILKNTDAWKDEFFVFQ